MTLVTSEAMGAKPRYPRRERCQKLACMGTKNKKYALSADSSLSAGAKSAVPNVMGQIWWAKSGVPNLVY